jgi:hypothetical protein
MYHDILRHHGGALGWGLITSGSAGTLAGKLALIAGILNPLLSAAALVCGMAVTILTYRLKVKEHELTHGKGPVTPGQ